MSSSYKFVKKYVITRSAGTYFLEVQSEPRNVVNYIMCGLSREMVVHL